MPRAAEQFKAVYREFSSLLSHIEREGSIGADSPFVLEALQALNAMDGGACGTQFTSSAKRLGSSISTGGPSWPKERDIGRFGDMSPLAHIRVGLDADNDVYVSVWDENGGGSIEFCQPGSGGGKSSRTRLALIALMVAMEADNAETPAFDWWARGASTKPPGAEAVQ